MSTPRRRYPDPRRRIGPAPKPEPAAVPALPPVDWEAREESEAHRMQAAANVADARAKARAVLIANARKDRATFCEFVLKDEETGGPIKLGAVHEAWHRAIDTYDRLVIWSFVEAGKAVPLDTPIATPTGWATMGALRPGDRVFGGDGKPCTVRACSAVQHNRHVFEVEFSDGAIERADADHNWFAWSALDRASHRPPRVVTTREMAESLRYLRDWNWTIPVAPAVEYPEGAPLPIHPYVLGAWLGDGDTADSTLTFHEDDRAIVDTCAAIEGGRCTFKRDPRGSGKVWRVRFGRDVHGSTLRSRLHGIGVLGAKHIPDAYLTASTADRRALLAGILDTDGSIDGRGGKSRIELTLTDARLAHDALELIRSLGFKASMNESDSKLAGRIVGRRWRITFTARVPVFRLARKLAKQKLTPGSPAARKKTVTAIREVASVPVKCISVDSPDNTYLLGRSFTVTHNTQNVSVGSVLYDLGQDPSLRIVVLSNTMSQAKKIVSSIRKYLTESEELRLVFPHLRQSTDPSAPWTQTALTVERSTFSKDPSVQAIGLYGALMGARADRLYIDDLLDRECTETPQQMDAVFSWLRATAIGRLTRNARVVAVTNEWNKRDPMHRLASGRGYHSIRIPVITKSGKLAWAARWSKARIAKAEEDLGPLEAGRQLYLRTRDEDKAVISQDWLARCINRGRGYRLVHEVDVNALPEGFSVWTGVDLAVQQHASADWTAFVTILLHPDGTRQLLWIEAGRWSGPEIVQRIEDHNRRYGSVIIIENNASQDFVLQFASHLTRATVRAFTTGKNKANPAFGVASLATEFSNGRWIFPSHKDGARVPREVAALLTEALYYDPKEHTGDRLMALWFAREGARMFERQHGRAPGTGVAANDDEGAGVTMRSF